MRVEHFALQVPEPVAMAEWYVKHVGCSVARAGGPPGHGRFLLDGAGSVMLEIYHNPAIPVPDYPRMDPMLVHVAFVSTDPAADRDRLVRAGATVVDDLVTAPSGDQIVTMRDPWGIGLQLIKRAVPMLK